jgi:hypothetical protein
VDEQRPGTRARPPVCMAPPPPREAVSWTSSPRWGTNVIRTLVWWPALSMIAVAARPGPSVVMIAGLGVALLMLGLVNTGLQAWLARLSGDRHGAAPTDGSSGGARQSAKD